MVGCVFLMKFQNCVQLCLSSLPNNKANPNADIDLFAFVPYTEYRVYFPKLMWSASACNTSCRKGNCSFVVDGEMKIPVKNLNWGPSSNPNVSQRKVSLSFFQLLTYLTFSSLDMSYLAAFFLSISSFRKIALTVFIFVCWSVKQTSTVRPICWIALAIA